MALSLLSTCKTTQTLTYSFLIYSLRLLIIAGVLLTPSQIFFVSFLRSQQTIIEQLNLALMWS